MKQMSPSLEATIAADRRWFEQHPDQREHRRPITDAEMQVTGNPSHTFVVVSRWPNGMQMRVFFVPDGPNN